MAAACCSSAASFGASSSASVGAGFDAAAGAGAGGRAVAQAHSSRTSRGRITEDGRIYVTGPEACATVSTAMPFAPFRERLEEVIRKLASTPGIDVMVKKLGRAGWLAK